MKCPFLEGDDVHFPGWEHKKKNTQNNFKKINSWYLLPCLFYVWQFRHLLRKAAAKFHSCLISCFCTGPAHLCPCLALVISSGWIWASGCKKGEVNDNSTNQNHQDWPPKWRADDIPHLQPPWLRFCWGLVLHRQLACNSGKPGHTWAWPHRK